MAPPMAVRRWWRVIINRRVLIRNSENEGFARANNRALRMCRGRYALLLNSDTEVQSTAVDTLISFLESAADVGIVGPKLLNSDGTLQPSGNPIPSVATHIWRCLPLPLLMGRSRNWYFDPTRDYNRILDVGEVSGAALLVRRDVWTGIGLLDEEYFFYCEDVDFCIRVRNAGWRVVYLPSARVLHHWGRSTRKADASIHPRAAASHFHYMRKHHGRWAEFLVRIALGSTAMLNILLLLILPSTQERKRSATIHVKVLKRCMAIK